VARSWALLLATLLPLSLLAFRPQAQPQPQEQCLGCHQAPGLVFSLPSGEKLPASVDPKVYKASRHGALDCTSCHQDKTGYPHTPTSYSDRNSYRIGMAQGCGGCHPQAREGWQGSVHGRAMAVGNTGAAVCTDCHRPHAVFPPDLVTQISSTCNSCHQPTVQSYWQSVHGRLVQGGRRDAANCADCHSRDQRVHTMESGRTPGSSSSEQEVPRTCGRCHPKALETYETTFHGRAWRLGTHGGAPTCIDCHGSFGVQPVHGPEGTAVSERLITTCAQCHRGVTPEFIKGWLGHEEPSRKHFPWVYYAERLLFYLTTSVLAFGILHVELDLLRWWVTRRKKTGDGEGKG